MGQGGSGSRRQRERKTTEWEGSGIGRQKAGGIGSGSNNRELKEGFSKIMLAMNEHTVATKMFLAIFSTENNCLVLEIL